VSGIETGRPIDILFVGDDKKGLEFMERLAKLTHGKVININDKLAKELLIQIEESVKILLLKE